MPAPRPSARDRRGRPAVQRSLTLTAAWSGLATALIASIAAVAAVAVVWLPASGGSGSAGSAIRAGLLTFLAAVHGGVTVDGLPTAFVPLGLTVLVAAVSWRATTTVVEAADEIDEHRPGVLLRALATQAGTFAVLCALLAAGSTLGTSSASIIGALLAGFVLVALVGTVALARHHVLGDLLRDTAPAWFAPAVRCAVAALAVQCAAGALLVVGSLVLHHDRVLTLSEQVGGGWSGVPVLLLGVLAVPNAVVAGAGYLSGAGFAVGSGTSVGLTSATTGTVPAFPILGALPDGDGATLPVWLLAALTPLVAGACVAAIAGRAGTAAARWRDAAAGVVVTALLGSALAWQAGGAIGSGRLHVVGVSPWRFALVLALGVGVVAAALLGVRAAVEFVREKDHEDRPGLRATIAALTAVEQYDDTHDDTDDTDDAGADDPAADDTGGRVDRAG